MRYQAFTGAHDPTYHFTIPAWAKGKGDVWRRSTRQRIVVLQFHVMHIGYHEEWAIIPENMRLPSDEETLRTIVESARTFYEFRWPGTSRDMACTGGAYWSGNSLRDMRGIQ